MKFDNMGIQDLLCWIKAFISCRRPKVVAIFLIISGVPQGSLKDLFMVSVVSLAIENSTSSIRLLADGCIHEGSSKADFN